MRDAVLHDLAGLDGVSTICTYDSRLPAPISADHAIKASGPDVWELWEECISKADAVLPIAPETGNALLKLTNLINEHDKALLGCSAAGVKLAGSKLATCRILQSAGIDVVPTSHPGAYPVHRSKKFVVKPDDGVGCEGAILFSLVDDFETWLATADADGYVAQPYVEGIPASFSMLCDHGQAWLLSCNRQKVSVHGNRFCYEGSVLNAVTAYWDSFERLAQQVAQAVPELSGYIGVDVIIRDGGISILEINPRLTTSYVGLHRALGYNPASLLIDLLYNCRFSPGSFKMPDHTQRNEIEISLNG
jgi:predicted ATP-grasp superfamily ATP-dependent carboligase